MAILVVGGAGYIGSHILRSLKEQNRETVVFDNLETGHHQAIGDAAFFQGDLRSKADLQKVFQDHAVEAVIHCAGCSLVDESMQAPERYYENNVSGTLNLLEAMHAAGISRLVYTSSGASYGEPERIPIDEEHQQVPASVYGHTKLCVEKMLEWFDTVYGLKSMVLRCFNAAGAHPSGDIGEVQKKATRLIPQALQAALGERENVPLYGTGYHTRDGSCVRDFVHVCDIAEAHIKALDGLAAGKPSAVFNIGRGTGVSVREIIETVQNISGRDIAVQEEPNRPGDPAILIASIQAAKTGLGWQPKYTDIAAILESAMKWQAGAARSWT